jgi:hypothetical protein
MKKPPSKTSQQQQNAATAALTCPQPVEGRLPQALDCRAWCWRSRVCLAGAGSESPEPHYSRAANSDPIRRLATRAVARHAQTLLRLPWLAPDITSDIVNGRQPQQLNAKTLMRQASRLPAAWAEQRALLGFR